MTIRLTDLTGSALITNSLVNLPKSACEVIHLDCVLQSIPQEVVIMGNLTYVICIYA